MYLGAGTFGDFVTAPNSRGGECRAEERRIRPIVEPPASDLVTVDPAHGRGKQLLRAAYAAYRQLKAAAEADGIPANILTIVSAYRSVASQRRLWEQALRRYGSADQARRWVAPPGSSAHHTGRAIDFDLGGRNDSSNVATLRTLPAYRWLVCNASRFGFFPYAREPWHWEFNPPAAAATGSQTAGWFGEPQAGTTPAFRFHEPCGCAPHAANQCRRILARAIRDAISLAENASAKLRARDAQAVRRFRAFFGNPEWQVPWANNKRAADLVADRFDAAVRGFRTRVPHFRCSTETGCNGFIDPDVTLGPAANPLPANTIFLCAPFWGSTVHHRAGTVLHEMLHLLFHSFLRHDLRYANAHCYEAFALRAAGFGAHPDDVTCCADPTQCDPTARVARA